ncbi:general substrate transporter [Stachybotrys elegans]|uniref:General substrate transporter n=1 Tax=Stachybotrys elegans TaxID=80388 RepID=A0A8K0SKH5_9HYPO|nr:general substrate transporter [Stachybotrys elegans]
MRTIIEAEVHNKTGWKTLFKTPGNRRRVFILLCLGCFSQWSGNGLISYYLVRVLETVGVSDSRERNILNGCLMIFNWLTSIASAFLTAYIKRRTQFMISVCGMFGVFASQALCAGLFNEAHSVAAGRAVIAILFIFYFSTALPSTPSSIPTRSKSCPTLSVPRAFRFSCSPERQATLLNLVNPIGLQALSWKYYFVYVGWLAIQVFTVWKFIVETKGPSLEAIAENFDGKVNCPKNDSEEETQKKDKTTL